jgi:dihydrolipoamide dehydrogenase
MSTANYKYCTKPRRTPLLIVFSDPNVAAVGARFAELNKNEIVIGAIDFSNQGRARMAAENRGVLRLYANHSDGRLLGAELCAPHGEHLAHLLALAIDRKLTVHQLLRLPFYHPVFEEGLRTALRELAARLPPTSHGELSACDPIGAVALE